MPKPWRLVRSPELSNVAEYAYASVVDVPGAVVFTAGACPLDVDGNTVAVEAVAAVRAPTTS